MRFLLDTNILIKLEPESIDDLEDGADEGIAFLRLVNAGDHAVHVHPAIKYDINRDENARRRERSRFVFSKYPLLDHPPSANAIYSQLGEPAEGSNDWVDFQLAAAASANAVAYVVTEDAALIRRMRRIGLGERATDLAGAVQLLESLYDHPVSPPPVVTETRMYSLDTDDPIWASFHQEYEGFDSWWERAARDGRPAWFVSEENGYHAVAIAKAEDDQPYGLQGKIFKICSFKVRGAARGRKLGELLLKTLFRYATSNGYDAVYVEVYPHHDDVVLLLEDFGFRPEPGRATERGELVLVKQLKEPVPPPSDVSELEYHRLYGPPCLHPSAQLFFVPIQPHYHKLLFPDLEEGLVPPSAQGALPGLEPKEPTPGPYGNALKKAYLCHAPTRRITEGSGLVFYRSGDLSAATTLGVVESTLVERDPTVIAAAVGQRTVYTHDQITEMTADGNVLSILFRHDRSFEPIGLEELVANSVIRAAPQSITLAKPEGIEWLRNRIAQ